MTALWIGITAAAVAVLVWRLRRAAALLDRILREERSADPDPASVSTEYTNDSSM